MAVKFPRSLTYTYAYTHPKKWDRESPRQDSTVFQQNALSQNTLVQSCYLLLCEHMCEHWGAWLAQLVEHAALDLGILSSSPTLGTEIT